MKGGNGEEAWSWWQFTDRSDVKLWRPRPYECLWSGINPQVDSDEILLRGWENLWAGGGEVGSSLVAFIDYGAERDKTEGGAWFPTKWRHVLNLETGWSLKEDSKPKNTFSLAVVARASRTEKVLG